MNGTTLSRNEMKGITGGVDPCEYYDPGCTGCTSSCLYDPYGPGAGCPPGGICLQVECPGWRPDHVCCEQFRYHTKCDWEV